MLSMSDAMDEMLIDELPSSSSGPAVGPSMPPRVSTGGGASSDVESGRRSYVAPIVSKFTAVGRYVAQRNESEEDAAASATTIVRGVSNPLLLEAAAEEAEAEDDRASAMSVASDSRAARRPRDLLTTSLAEANGASWPRKAAAARSPLAATSTPIDFERAQLALETTPGEHRATRAASPTTVRASRRRLELEYQSDDGDLGGSSTRSSAHSSYRSSKSASRATTPAERYSDQSIPQQQMPSSKHPSSTAIFSVSDSDDDALNISMDDLSTVGPAPTGPAAALASAGGVIFRRPLGGADRPWSTPSMLSLSSSVDRMKARCAPPWTNIKTFVVVICVLITVHGTLSTGYLMAVISTIEKRFELPSRISGLVVSSYEFGSLLSVLFVSYFGSQRNIPRWVGAGALLLSVGTFLFATPHFIASPYVAETYGQMRAMEQMQTRWRREAPTAQRFIDVPVPATTSAPTGSHYSMCRATVATTPTPLAVGKNVAGKDVVVKKKGATHDRQRRDLDRDRRLQGVRNDSTLAPVGTAATTISGVAPSSTPSNSILEDAPLDTEPPTNESADSAFYLNATLTTPAPGVIVRRVKMDGGDCVNGTSTASNYVFVFVIAQVLIGVGGSPIFTLGTTYIDNHVVKEDSAVYLACMYVTVALGPVCGFLLGGLMLNFYVEPNVPPPSDLDSSSPAWIGRWWAGFFICGALYFISALPFFFFPKRLPGTAASRSVSASTSRSQTPTPGAEPPSRGMYYRPPSASSLPQHQLRKLPPNFAAAETRKSLSSSVAVFPPAQSLQRAVVVANAERQQLPPLPLRRPESRVSLATDAGSVATTGSASVGGTPSEYGQKLKDIPCSIVRLLRNSVYMVASLGACVDLAIVSGFTVFLPKYMENQFRVSKAFASILTGSVAIPGACFGIFLGGWVLKKYQLQLKGASQLIVSVNCFALVLFTLFFFLGCDNVRVAGANSPYRPFESRLYADEATTRVINLTDPCNSGCLCTLADIQPVCGANGLTYLSPCFAGCSKFVVEPVATDGEVKDGKRDVRLNFTQCTCIPPTVHKEGEPDGGYIKVQPLLATEGFCRSNCRMLVPFLVLLFILAFIASTTQMPLVMITLRSVAEEEKAFALGLQVVFLRLFTYIPAPILFGSVIDTTCIVWKDVCGVSASSSCLLYNIEGFRLKYAAVAMALKVIGSALSITLWWCVKKHYVAFSPPITMSEIARRLGSAENLHLADCRTGTLRPWNSDESLYARPKPAGHAKRRHTKTRSC